MAVLVLATFFTGCNAVDSSGISQTQKAIYSSAPYNDGARRATIAQLETLIKEGKVVVVDVRDQASYDAAHIPGARVIPSGEILNHLQELPRDKTIITYCSWPEEHTSAGAVVALKSKGIENAAALLGGFQLWQREGKPVDRKKQIILPTNNAK
jgi:rhodanese-related sulfurtransferase